MKKKIWIGLTIFLFIAFSYQWQWWRKNEPGISIFMYHRIGYPVKDARNKGLWVSPKRFKSQLEYLKKNRYTCITFKQLKTIWDAQDFPEKTVILTFDDGYQDLYENAFPILQEYDFPAVVFPIVGYLGNEFPSRKKGRREYKILSIEEIKEMKKSGIQFGSHSLRHLHLSQLKEQEKQIEISESKRILEEILREPVIVYCYP